MTENKKAEQTATVLRPLGIIMFKQHSLIQDDFIRSMVPFGPIIPSPQLNS